MGILSWFIPTDQRNYTATTESFRDYGVTDAQLKHARRLELDGTTSTSSTDEIKTAACMRDLRYDRPDANIETCAKLVAKLSPQTK